MQACFQGVDVADSVDELPGSHKLAKVLAQGKIIPNKSLGRIQVPCSTLG
jgi:hypothetical protein